MADDASSSVPPPVVVRNEFSLVELSYVRDGDATALVVADADSGDRVVLGAAELASLARSSHESFRRLLRAIDDHQDSPE
jgi:hypothetical protein